MAKKPSKFRRGKGLQFDAKLEGLDELRAKLVAMGKKAYEVLDEATAAALQPTADAIRQDAPGPHILQEKADKPNKKGVVAHDVGPDKDHWFYQFSETGVQPFEVDLVRKKTKRSGGGRRKVRGEAQALKFPGSGGEVFAKRIRRGGIPAKPFMRKNFLGRERPMVTTFGQVIEQKAIGPLLESK